MRVKVVVKRAPSSLSPRRSDSSLPLSAARLGGIDANRLLRILPQRPPMLLIDRVIEFEPRKSARAWKAISVNEPAVRGHFPAAPVFPPTLVLESLSQLMCVLLYASQALDPTCQQFALAGVDKVKFRQPIVPGDRLELTLRVLHHRSNIWKCAGVACVDDVLCVEAELLAAVQDCEEFGQ
jgi:3-hydroxyacyl-[acyl-carrier-protein] dehydratase